MALAAFVQGGGELFQQFFLLLGEIDGGFEVDGAIEVAGCAAAHRLHAFAFQAEGFAGLGFGGDGEHHAAGKRRHFDFAAKRGSGEADRHVAVQVVAVAGEDRVLAHADFHEQIACRRAEFARFAFAGKTDAVAGIHAGGDVDGERFLLFDAAFAVAFVAGIFDDLPAAFTSGAGLGDGEKALLHAHLSRALAGGAGFFGGFVVGAVAVAFRAGDVGRDADFFLGAVDGFFQG